MSRTRIIPIVLVLLAVVSLVGVRIVGAKPKADAPAPQVGGDEARWTIYCRAIAGPDHVARANAIKADLLRLKQFDDWYVIHEDDQSVIYEGHYRSMNDPKDASETARAQADHKAIAALKDSQGNKVFETCGFVQVSAPDPNARPEWDLRNAKGYWSIEIAVYKDDPRRKQAAVDTVNAARHEGEEAYYYHGPTASSVCIGAWPRDAVREQESDKEVFQDQVHDILVLPGIVDLPGNLDIRNRDGEKVNAVAPRTEIVDPTMLKTFAKYPNRGLNGEDYVKKVVDPVTKVEKEVPQQSVLVPIPQQEASLLRPANTPQPTLIAPTTPSQTPGAGQLKSIGQ